MGIRKQEKVFKEISKLTGWKFQKYNNYDFSLFTDIEAPRHDKDYPVYINIDFHQYYSCNEKLDFIYSEKPFDRVIARYRINGKRPTWNVPKACDFSDISKAQEYANMIVDYFTKKSTKLNKNAKKKDLEFVSQRAEYFDFYEKMNKLAETCNGSFNENEQHKLRTWEFCACAQTGKVEINWYNGDPNQKDKFTACWRVRIPTLNYSFFKCPTLEHVYNLCKWFVEMPVPSTYKF